MAPHGAALSAMRLALALPALPLLAALRPLTAALRPATAALLASPLTGSALLLLTALAMVLAVRAGGGREAREGARRRALGDCATLGTRLGTGLASSSC
jgi:hypothetical protein